ncbi:MAG: cytochrome c peroxidase [Flavobacteriales bacterium]|nr:cytochrome c peroxidase [Flavobacteriales bacterium]
MRLTAVLCATVVFTFSCNEGTKTSNETVRYKIPRGFEDPAIPAENLPTPARLELGRRLFYDKRMSLNDDISCGSCHALSSAFTDGKKVSNGSSGKSGRRNSPTLANMAWYPYFMAEGGVPTLEMQSLAPIHDTVEMGMNVLALSEKLKSDKRMNALSQRAYNRDIDPYVITRALACFQRSFISGDSRYDRYLIDSEKFPLTEAEERGRRLFFSNNTACSVCHSGYLFTDFGFYNVGLYDHYEDSGKERESYLPADSGKFKTPTLRNIELTAPYMHDGSMNNLEDVMRHYNEGGKAHSSKDLRVRPLNLSEEQIVDLIAFMKTLTDWNFVQNKELLPLE